MCLAIPMRLEAVEGRRGRVLTNRVESEVMLDLVDARVGDYVLVHAGYAIQVVDEREAREVLALLSELPGAEGRGR